MFNKLFIFCMKHHISMRIYIAELYNAEITLQQGNWNISYKIKEVENLDTHYEMILDDMIKRLEQ